ncbi:helix-turn-helix transcriptional regulator [Mesorhizobium sp. B2-3-15]|uniref:helix-turn-helix transcriptional regulator n=1 Tax=Mesorhizobium sp. B2-3-15 TaxID=2589949 RepID=UPI001127FADC|nr:helix-turn-helix transcriptional regulator [Mesorhizobium sp. B2-3-15]TPL71662.1 helix-turn-helix domain-containing protein [Mesorhizobium sp. B2-3-15]
MELLTTSEAADYLRIGERKLYELIAQERLPCSKVAGKWLFPRHELDRWVMSGLVRPGGMIQSDPPPIVGGSQDDLLEWSLRQSGSGLAFLTEGTEAGVTRLLRGEVSVAAIHFHSDDPDPNVTAIATRPRLYDAVLVGFARREQGLLLAPGNPKSLNTLTDVLATGARIAVRQRGAGADMLLTLLLTDAGASHRDVNRLEPPCLTGPELAAAVRTGRADCGIATRAAACAAGLDFVSLAWESFDLLMRQRTYFQQPIQALLRLLQQDTFASRAAELAGYDPSPAGRIRFAK